MDFSYPVETRRLARSRGFTLVELMLVVVIIGIIAVIAVPSMLSRMRERRADQAAQQIALIYRDARLRAMGRGFAVLVNYQSATNTFTVLETRPAGGLTDCVPRLPPSCLDTNWALATATTEVEHFSPDSSVGGLFEGVKITVNEQPSGTTASNLALCFTPRGRTFSRDAASNPLQAMTGVIEIVVGRAAPMLQRRVNVLPNGMARVAL